jgi:hypothetical protein
MALQSFTAEPSLQPVIAAKSNGTFGPQTIAAPTIGRKTQSAIHEGMPAYRITRPITSVIAK